MADIGINFRSTAGYVTDGANETYCIGDTYPTSRGGFSFGWTAALSDGKRDRSTSVDRRLAGINKAANSATGRRIFRIELPFAGPYEIHLALGDVGSDQLYQYAVLKDGAATIATLDQSSGTRALTTAFYDAAANLRTKTSWPTDEVKINHTFSSTTFYLEIGTPTTQTGDSTIAHVRLVSTEGSSSPSSSPSGSASASPSASVSESPSTSPSSSPSASASGSVSASPSASDSASPSSSVSASPSASPSAPARDAYIINAPGATVLIELTESTVIVDDAANTITIASRSKVRTNE